MKKTALLTTAILAMTACTNTNPFLEEWDTPYGIPPFEKIKVEHYVPAVKAGIEQQAAEIEAIVSNPDAPTFENTIAAYDRSGEILAKVTGVLYNVSETDNTPELEAVMDEVIPLLSDHSDNISFNKALYERVAAVYNADQSGLTREQQVVLKKIYDGFIREGVGLSDADQEILRQINSEMATKCQKIGNNILADSNAFRDELGFSVSEFPTKMTETADRDLREKIFKMYSNRGHNGNANDNRQLILDVLGLRIRKAQLMGYKTPAAYELADKMAATPEAVDEFLDGIIKASVAKAGEEIVDMQSIMDEDIKAGLLPEGTKIQAWDWWYYAERVRKAKYDLDESLTQPYFHVDNVRKGIFEAAHMLYGINAEEITDVPVYNPEVRTFKITDADGSLIGIFTTDYRPRPSKRGGAWMNNVRNQYVDAEGNDIRPIIVNVCNHQEYNTIDEVQTAFHEFGHALHGLLSKCHYVTVSGTSVAQDFVEVFSQINENFAFQPELLAKYAYNADGETIPAELVEKINNSLKFNQGFMTTELCAASILDMKWHELESIDGIDIDEFEKKVCDEMGLIDEIIPRYRTTYFNHIFASGYNAGYYGYLWAEVLDKDAFSIFEANGVWDKELAMKFRATFLERGGSEDPMVLYKEFAGREPDSRAFLRGRGLVD